MGGEYGRTPLRTRSMEHSQDNRDRTAGNNMDLQTVSGLVSAIGQSTDHLPV